MVAKLLTKAVVDRLKPDPTKRIEVPDRQQVGLFVIVQPTGRRSYAVRTRLHDKPIKVTLGDCDVVDLSDARKRAHEIIVAAKRGEDPREKVRAARAMTVANAVDDFVRRYAKGRGLKSWKEIEGRLKRDLVRAYGPRPIAELTRGDLVRLLDEMADRGVEQGRNRLLAHTHRFLAWCEERGLVESNVAARIRKPAREVARDRVLDDDELRAVWLGAGAIGWPFGPLVRTMIATAQREGEVAALRWSGVDLDGKVWILPREATKADRRHEVPLSDLAVDVIKGVPVLVDQDGKTIDLAFSTTGTTPPSGWARAKERLDKAAASVMGRELAAWRLHDLRRTAASAMAMLGHPPHVVAAVLNHTPGSVMGITAVYNRHRYTDEKRAALDAWARYLDRIVTGQTAEVVQLRSA
ncbi:MAG: site-specific integrase [Geminicoccaceae bacterium]